MNSLLRSILSILSGKVASILISLVFTPILVRVISQEQYGLFASLIAGFSILMLIFRGGLFDASRKIVAEHSDDPHEVSLVISITLLLSLIYGVSGTFLVILSLYLNLFPNEYVLFIWILTIALLFGNIHNTITGSFHGLQYEYLGEILGVSQQILYTIFGLTLAYIGYDLIGVFVGYTISFVIVCLVGISILYSYFSFIFPSIEDIATRGKEIASYGGFQLIGGVSAAFLYKADILLVEYFRGSTATALYNSALIPAEMIWFVPWVIQVAFLQHTASLWSHDEIDTINNHIQTGFKYGVLSLTLFGVGLFVLADPFLNIYFGEEYVEAAATLQVLIFGTFFFGVIRVIVPVFQATGWIRQTEFVTVGALVLNIMINILLIPRYGIIGAGIGTALSYVFISIGNTLVWIRSPFRVVSLRWGGRLVFVQIIFSVIFYLITSALKLSPLISLLVFPPIGFVLFTIVNIWAGYLPISVVESYLKPIFR